MAGRSSKHPKHIPQRTCVGCRTVRPKRSLIRLVVTAEGILIDDSGKLPGRGAYLHAQRSCWELGLNGSLAHALRTGISPADEDKLRKYSEILPEDASPGD